MPVPDLLVPDLLPADHRPDYRRLEKVLTRSAIPDRVPFYELFIEDTMVERTFRRVDLRHAFACIMGDDLSHGGGTCSPG